MMYSLTAKPEVQLSRNLNHFGLNPSEWSVEKIKSHKFLIRNVEDRNFIFWGQSKKVRGHLQWQKIELISI